MSWHRHRRTWDELADTVAGYGTGVYAMLTSGLLRRETTAVRIAASWFRHDQFPRLAGGLLGREPRVPLSLLLGELAGCARGPLAYFRSRRLLRRQIEEPRDPTRRGRREARA